MTELAVTLTLSDQARARLADRAAASGQDVSAYASHLLERVVARPTADELLGEDGISDDDLEFFRGEIAAYRREKRLPRQGGAGPG